jgi:hypothetical protein
MTEWNSVSEKRRADARKGGDWRSEIKFLISGAIGDEKAFREIEQFVDPQRL